MKATITKSDNMTGNLVVLTILLVRMIFIQKCKVVRLHVYKSSFCYVSSLTIISRPDKAIGH